jgi:organic hydroperoxide reductase OsmC/OhrA
MKGQHHYRLTLKWTGNKGSGTSAYQSYDRSHTISVNQKPDIFGSSDPGFRGDPTKHNPEELFLAAISSCHMLWYLHLCSEAEIIIIDYEDKATGTMTEDAAGGGKFTEVVLNPLVTITEKSAIKEASALHQKANQLCFIANSLNFPVLHQPSFKVIEA